ncbi:MAG: phage/plasmid primase, P4 family [Lachnospiraceae bacterium]|nr:phage/plasmid primase, P4 family [Lachnospiraceae bacterium]
MNGDLKNIAPQKLAELDRTIAMFNPDEPPEWYDGTKIDEIAFSEYFLSLHPMKCIHDRLYDIDGMVQEERIRKELLDEVKPYLTTNVAKNVNRILEAVKLFAFSEELAIQEDRIHLRNGTYFLTDRRFDARKEFCMNRLPVKYNSAAAPPDRWLAFLNELLYPEDIPTLQEFMGYALIPTNKGQKMMLIVGNGGEGKSRIGRVLRALLGDNMSTFSIQKLSCDRFAKADLDGQLLLLDDDMKMDALTETNVLKTVITMEDKIDLERKGKQSVQGFLYCRIIAFGNGSLSALYDRSDGFYRRQIGLQVREKTKGRVDDTSLGEKLIAESEGILLWCLEGLHRLIGNGYSFTISDRTRRNMEENQRADNNMMEFYEAETYIRFEPNTYATTRQIFSAYERWCQDNVEKPLAEKTFTTQLKKDANRLGIRYDKNLDAGNGKRARGYHGIHVMIRTDDGWQRNR